MADNPLLEGLETDRRAPPCVLVVYGASGDLTSRKLMPAVENLALRRLLPPGFSVVGVARTEMDDRGFFENMQAAVEKAGSFDVNKVRDALKSGLSFDGPGGKVTTLTRYYITSRTLTADQLLEAVRGHWSIENSVHWVLDVVFGDDYQRLRSDYGPRNMALVQRIALNLIRRRPSAREMPGER